MLHSCRLRPMIGLLREREDGWTFAARRRLRPSSSLDPALLAVHADMVASLPEDLVGSLQSLDRDAERRAVDTFVAAAHPWKPTELGCPECGGTVRINPSRLGQRAAGREVVVD